MKLLVATMFHHLAAGFVPYINSLVNSVKLLSLAGIDFDFLVHPGDSYVDRGRNTVCAKFLEGDYTDLLFIDSDMEWDISAINRILVAPGEVVGGTYPMKNMWANFPVGLNTGANGKPLGNAKTGLLSASWVMMGFTKISRSCLEKMQEAYKDTAYNDPSADPSSPDRTYYKFFETKLGVGGEDQTFCKNWKAIGGEIWLEPRISFGHYGVNGWHGNYHDYLMAQPGGINDPANFGKTEPISTLKDKHINETIYIVGKGPSLANLRSEHFGDGPVITLNQAIIAVENLNLTNEIYSMQKDGGIDAVVPKKAALIIHKHESEDLFIGYSPRYMFDNILDFNISVNAVSLISALNISKLMGCSKVVIMCCDSLVNNDERTCIPKPDGEFDTFLDSRLSLGCQYSYFADGAKNYLNNFSIPHEYLTPEGEMTMKEKCKGKGKGKGK